MMGYDIILPDILTVAHEARSVSQLTTCEMSYQGLSHTHKLPQQSRPAAVSLQGHSFIGSICQTPETVCPHRKPHLVNLLIFAEPLPKPQTLDLILDIGQSLRAETTDMKDQGAHQMGSYF